MGGTERIRLILATGLGTGYAPLAPGTVGSLVGLALVWPLWRLGGIGWVMAGAVAVTLVGYWAAGAGESAFGRRDPGQVVIDEVAGQMVSLLFLAPTPTALVTGFLLFRLFDIWKPWPVRQLEKLPGSSGIMTDDLMAGLYANIAHQILRSVVPGGWGGT